MIRTLFFLLLFPFWAVAQLPVVLVPDYITQETFWSKDTIYLMKDRIVIVKNNATLRIEPGTTIKAERSGTLIFERGTKIIADGTPDAPIVFTSNKSNPTYGDWGGIMLAGYSSTNNNIGSIHGLSVLLGGCSSSILCGGGDLPGGPILDDSSGVMRYVRIEYAGYPLQPSNELNGLTLGAVGSRTMIDHVEVSYSGDDAFEFVGGTVSCSHLISLYSKDDDFDFDFGYQGNLQFLLAIRDNAVADVSGSNGFETDNNPNSAPAVPFTAPNISNATIVGPFGSEINSYYKRAAHLRRNSKSCIANSIFMGNWPVGIFIDGNSTAQNALDGELKINNSVVSGATQLISTNATNGFDINSWFASLNNIAETDPNYPQLKNPYSQNGANFSPLLTPASPVYQFASFTTGCAANDPFFQPVSYVGAFDTVAASAWTNNWSQVFALTGNPSGTDIAPEKNWSAHLAPSIVRSSGTRILIQAQEATDASYIVVNASGQTVAILPNTRLEAGMNELPVSSTGLPAGRYWIRLQVGAQSGTLTFTQL